MKYERNKLILGLDLKIIKMKAELKEIERLTIKNDGYESFDTWGSDARSMLYFFLVNEFKEKGINSFTGENGRYLVHFRHGHSGRGGMDMGSPDAMVVETQNTF